MERVSPENGMSQPSGDVISSQLHRQARAAVRRINLGSMIHELQLRVALRRLGTVPDHRPVGSFEKAEERPRPGVVVGCHSFDRRLSPEPGDRAGTIGSIGVAPAHPVPEGHTLSRDPGYTLPAVVEVLGRIWPSIVERPDLTHLYDDGRLPHRRCGFPRA